jgi:tau tubulin kinase
MGELKIPSTIGRWTVTSKLGSGAFGDVYLVKRYRKHAKQYGFAAMKIEEHQKSRDDEVLRMEIFVLMKLQGQMSFTTIYDKGQTKNFRSVSFQIKSHCHINLYFFSYVIMSLLMKPVEEFRQDQPTRRFSILTTLKIGLQMINVSY